VSEQTFQLTLPSGLAEAFVASLKQLLKAEGFEESLEAGEVGGVETSVWRRGDAEVVILLRESDVEERVDVSARNVDGEEIVKAAAARLVLKFLESLPPKVHQAFEPVTAHLKQVARCEQ